ncbi:EcsC protein family protein [Solimonas aquatica]|uniref:EcsC protein family protein n=1 Tax=Solimonas aquatica TaxID=489703 RepID=A0A1H9EX43_9GAMM|nr:EcsC family protein [Solimonas aquatica]SEQ29548.1 EcsC protein family protein [Solimonas aquatica]
MSASKKRESYEQQQWRELQRWLNDQPDWGTRVMAPPSRIAAYAAQHLVPVAALRAVLRGADQAASWSAAQRDVLRAAGVDTLAAMAQLPLSDCDRQARRVEWRAMALAGSSGTLFGVAGAAGMVVDVPTLLTLALRTIHRSAFCYGEDWRGESGQSLAIGVFALASANSLEEKQSAWQALQEGGELYEAAWRDGVERVAERELAKEAAQLSLKTLAQRVGLNLGRRKALGVMPVLGAVLGGAVNAGYLRDVAKVARYALQYRWLQQHQPELLARHQKNSKKEKAHAAGAAERSDDPV